jgi:UMF1 family MFS transporter
LGGCTVHDAHLFPAYFTTGVVRSDVLGQAVWGYTIAASGLIVALLAPSLGAIADAGGRRKPWIFAFALLCMLGSGLLWFARPESSALGWAIACVITANLGYEGAVMFTSAMLPDIVSKAHIGRFSGWAWGLGYIGGLVALALALFLFISPDVPAFGLDRGQAEDVRAVGPLVATWLGLFGLPLFLFTPDRRPAACRLL